MKLKQVLGSSQIKSWGYNRETQVLVIEFQKGGLYKYTDVPTNVIQDFQDADSLGGFLNIFIKGKYSFEKLTAEQVKQLV